MKLIRGKLSWVPPSRGKFLTGKTVYNLPGKTGQGVQNYLENTSPEVGVTGAAKGPDGSYDLGPQADLFRQQLDPILAQAKESAGNLTGSGFANTLGKAAGRSTADFLQHLLEMRSRNYLQLLQGTPTAHQPGFLDYLMQGAKSAAPFFAGPAGAAAAGAADFTDYSQEGALNR